MCDAMRNAVKFCRIGDFRFCLLQQSNSRTGVREDRSTLTFVRDKSHEEFTFHSSQVYGGMFNCMTKVETVIVLVVCEGVVLCLRKRIW